MAADRKLFSCLLLLVVFVLMYVLNSQLPLSYGDDYIYSFVWEGWRMMEPLPEQVQRVAGWGDLLRSQWSHYFTWGGRTVAHTLAQFFLWQGKALFNVCNALMAVLLVLLIYWISDEGRVGLDLVPSRVAWIFFILWAFTPGFPSVFLWLTGACNYLWTSVLLLLFLLPYVRYYFRRTSPPGGPRLMAALGLAAGWTNENTVGWAILAVLMLLYRDRRQPVRPSWLAAGGAGLFAGYALLLLSPGNVERMTAERELGAAANLLDIWQGELSVLALVMVWQLILWFFFFSTLRRYRAFPRTVSVQKSLMVARVFAAASLGSNLVMFLSPAFPIRSAFPSLVYLLIAMTVLIRLQKDTGAAPMDPRARRFLHIVGAVYFAVTVPFTLYGFQRAVRYNEMVVARARQEAAAPTGEIVEVPQFQQPLWLLRATGFRLFDLKISDDENAWMNVTVARYYGIRGIRSREEVWDPASAF